MMPTAFERAYKRTVATMQVAKRVAYGVPVKTDIDRLHAVVDGRLSGRGCGKTFARCHEVAGAIELGFKNIVCIITRAQDIEYLSPMIRDVFDEHYLHFARSTKEPVIYSGWCRIQFIVDDDQLEQHLRGRKGYLVPMRYGD